MDLSTRQGKLRSSPALTGPNRFLAFCRQDRWGKITALMCA